MDSTILSERELALLQRSGERPGNWGAPRSPHREAQSSGARPERDVAAVERAEPLSR